MIRQLPLELSGGGGKWNALVRSNLLCPPTAPELEAAIQIAAVRFHGWERLQTTPPAIQMVYSKPRIIFHFFLPLLKSMHSTQAWSDKILNPIFEKEIWLIK